MSVRKNLSDLNYYKQLEHEEHDKLNTIEDIKKDVKRLLKNELQKYNINNAMLLYYDKKDLIISNVLNEMLKIKIEDTTGFDIDFWGIPKKYEGFNKEHLKELINEVLYDYLKALDNSKKEYSKIKNIDLKQEIFNILVNAYNKNGYDYVLNNGLNILKLNNYDISNINILENYKKALTLFKSIYKPTKQVIKTKSNLGVSVLACVLGAFHGLSRK